MQALVASIITVVRKAIRTNGGTGASLKMLRIVTLEEMAAKYYRMTAENSLGEYTI